MYYYPQYKTNTKSHTAVTRLTNLFNKQIQITVLSTYSLENVFC